MIGTVETLHERYGFIRGEDGVSRFFMPSGLSQDGNGGTAFSDMSVGDRVEFVHIDHPRGPRAVEVVVLEAYSGNQD